MDLDALESAGDSHELRWYVEGEKRGYYHESGKPLSTVVFGPGDAGQVRIPAVQHLDRR